MSIHEQSLHHKMIAHAIIILLFKNADKKDAEIFYPKSYQFSQVKNCLYPLSISNFHYPLCISLKFSEKRVNWYARSLFRGV